MHPSEPKYEVFFMDYGNRERLPSDRVRPADAALAAVPAQARAATLAYLRVRTRRGAGCVAMCVCVSGSVSARTPSELYGSVCV